MKAVSLSEIQRRFVEGSGQFFRGLGLPRTTGQVYGLVYLSPEALTLNDFVARLKLSKGSASIASRQLLQLEAIRKIWIPGDRRPHFEVVEDVSIVAQNFFKQFIREPIRSSLESLDAMFLDLNSESPDPGSPSRNIELCRRRLTRLLDVERNLDKSLSLLLKQLR